MQQPVLVFQVCAYRLVTDYYGEVEGQRGGGGADQTLVVETQQNGGEKKKQQGQTPGAQRSGACETDSIHTLTIRMGGKRGFLFYI